MNHELPPEILQNTLPLLSIDDLKNLSRTNKYYHKLLDIQNSETVWKEIYHQTFATPQNDDEPFPTKEENMFTLCSEQIISTVEKGKTWRERYAIRAKQTQLYTWGLQRHGRLGYIGSSNPALRSVRNSSQNSNQLAPNYDPAWLAVYLPTPVPWFSQDKMDDFIITNITSGGFSFQILTKSGKIFSTGSSFTGGLRGPGPAEGQQDFDEFQHYVREIERRTQQITSAVHNGPTPTNIQPHTFLLSANRVAASRGHISVGNTQHLDIYEKLKKLQTDIEETVDGNPHIQRMLPKEVLPSLNSSEDDIPTVNKETLNSLKFKAVASGRSHFVGLSGAGDVYIWDDPDINSGIKMKFGSLPDSETHPIMKIGCGWNFTCVYKRDIGLITWRERDALKQGETSCEAHYEVIPFTGDTQGPNKVVDFTCLSDGVVYFITQDQRYLHCYRNKIHEEFTTPIEEKLLKISSCHNCLILFTENHCFSFSLDGNDILLNTIRRIDLQDPDDRVISVSGGDYHTLMLTKNGQLYSTGIESQRCGSLGLGIYTDQSWGHLEGNNDVRVEQPTKIDIGEGNVCVAIAAGGWQSSALIIKV